MATAGSECLENQNSTDCLLRALLNIFAEQKQAQDAGIDWDPITFGFTLLIGLVASMIALATVFQAVLAGGKGGRRANARAIGRWSKRTTRKWIFSEMSWSYTAFTPILRLKELEQGIEEITRLREEERENPPESGPSLSLYSKIVMWVTSSKLAPLWVKKKLKDVGNLASDVAPYPATWLGLFKATGLEGFDNEFDLTPVTADYLPDDFIAVPASAEVGAIVVITAAAGVQRLDVDTDLYPVIIGCNFQFDFRQHPVLGVIGAFSEHRRRGGNSHMSTPTLEKLREAGKHSNGTIELRNIYDIPEFNMLQGKGGQSMLKVIQFFGRRHRGLDSFVPHYDAIHHHCRRLASFILAKSPEFTPSLFPAQVWEGHNPFTAFALNGRFWAKVTLQSMAQEGLFEVPDVANPTSEKPGQQQPPLTAQGIHYKMLQALGSLIDGFDLGKDTLVAALKIRHDSTGHLIHLRSHLSDELFSAPSRQVELQLTSEDKEHLRHFQRQLEDTTFPIERLIGSEYDMPSTFFNTYQVLSRLATVLGRQPKSEDQNKWKTRPNEKIDDMIIYRSLLIGVLFNTALDNSKLLESGLWDRVVPVI
ncbi:putative purine nucleoside permease [Colletotrichum scovillei]|nr:putative purine nucleoside permease [Colletotrichum scovillei]